MKYPVEKLISLLENKDYSSLENFFNEIDEKSNSINDWQSILGYKLNFWSCELVHKIRNTLMNALQYHNGVSHLNNSKYPQLADIQLMECLNYLQKGEAIKSDLNQLHIRLNKILYN